VGAAVVAHLLAVHVEPVRAAEPAKAEELIRRGVQLRQQGQDTRALPFFQQAYEISPSPRTAAQLGLVEMALGYQLDAEGHLGEALSAAHDLWVHKNWAVLEDSIRRVRQAIGQIAIRGPDGAEAFVNGKSVGRLPLLNPVRVGEGPSTVELRASGASSAARSVHVMGGKTEEVTLALQPDRTAPLAIASGDRQQAPEAVTVQAPRGSARGDRQQSNHQLRLAAWITAAGSAASLGFAVFETTAWLSRKRDFEQHVGPKLDNPAEVGLSCGADDPQRGGAGCDALYKRMQGPRTLAIVGYAVAAGLAVSSVVLFSTSPASPVDTTAHQAFSCAPSWSRDGVRAECRLTF
jgi:hypothetical protein